MEENTEVKAVEAEKKVPAKRAEEEALHVVQGGHVEFTHTLLRRNFGQYLEEELVQQSFAGPLCDGEGEEWL